MGITDAGPDPNSTSHSETASLLTPTNPPTDKFNLAYTIYFTLGAGYLLPWNAFITAVDYFSLLYPSTPVDRVFAVVYMLVGLTCLLLIVLYGHRSNPVVRINVGLGLFVVALSVVPGMDVGYVKGRVGVYGGFWVTVAAVAVSAVADALVQGGVVGAAGELPERYMQAVIAGTAASGVSKLSYENQPSPGQNNGCCVLVCSYDTDFVVSCVVVFSYMWLARNALIYDNKAMLANSIIIKITSWLRELDCLVKTRKCFKCSVLVSFLRIFTKAVYPQDAHGLRQSANLYFLVSIIGILICIVFYNLAPRLPVIKYHDLKNQAITEEKEEKGTITGPIWRSTLVHIFGRVKWFGFAISIIYVVTLSIFPGYITEDVHSLVLKDWYPVLLITAYNVFDLFGKSLTALYLFDNGKSAIGLCFGRLLFLPLFWGCLHGPEFFRTEFPVTFLTCLLGLTNGYLTSVLFIMAPKVVQLQHAGTAGVVIVLFLVVGMAIGSVVAWFWVI